MLFSIITFAQNTSGPTLSMSEHINVKKKINYIMATHDLGTFGKIQTLH